MKIAIVTLNGETISQHFGRSPYFKIIEIQNKNIIGEELRVRRTGHFAHQSAQIHHHHTHDHESDKGHGYSQDSQKKHSAMAEEISDCSVLIAGGMGMGAYENFKSAGLEVFMTDKSSIREAVDEYISGNLKDLRQERTH